MAPRSWCHTPTAISPDAGVRSGNRAYSHARRSTGYMLRHDAYVIGAVDGLNVPIRNVPSPRSAHHRHYGSLLTSMRLGWSLSRFWRVLGPLRRELCAAWPLKPTFPPILNVPTGQCPPHRVHCGVWAPQCCLWVVCTHHARWEGVANQGGHPRACTRHPSPDLERSAPWLHPTRCSDGLATRASVSGPPVIPLKPPSNPPGDPVCGVHVGLRRPPAICGKSVVKCDFSATFGNCIHSGIPTESCDYSACTHTHCIA